MLNGDWMPCQILIARISPSPRQPAIAPPCRPLRKPRLTWLPRVRSIGKFLNPPLLSAPGVVCSPALSPMAAAATIAPLRFGIYKFPKRAKSVGAPTAPNPCAKGGFLWNPHFQTPSCKPAGFQFPFQTTPRKPADLRSPEGAPSWVYFAPAPKTPPSAP